TKVKKTIITFGVIIYIFVFPLVLISVSADSQYNYNIEYATKDSFISSYEPDTNFGGQDYLKLKKDWLFEDAWVYISFNIGNMPESYEYKNVYLYFSWVDKTITVEIWEASNNWDEYSITWNNKPNLISQIASYVIPKSGKYGLRLDNLTITGPFTLCLKIASPNDTYVSIDSKEDKYGYAPRIVWFYKGSSNPENSDYYSLDNPALLIVILMLFAVVIVSYVMIVIKNSKNPSMNK
ncbi:MAG: CBM96 family carbohydrate-binding protein, partial [Promethearchaeota archaeon]